jgi:hypothetical protein
MTKEELKTYLARMANMEGVDSTITELVDYLATSKFWPDIAQRIAPVLARYIEES